MTRKTLPLGPVATDLTPSQTLILCLALLTDVAPALAQREKTKRIVGLVESGATLSKKDVVILNRTLPCLFADLNRCCAPLTYFGYHPSAHDTLGVWIDLEALHKAETSGKVSQFTGSWRGVKSAYVLDMTGSGLTLYRTRGKTEVWHVA